MLDRSKIIREFMRIKDRLFVHNSYNLQLLYEIWNRIGTNEELAQRILASCERNLLPGWIGKVTDTFPIAPVTPPYSVIGCDGSQIYPDRHGPLGNCFVLNIGTVVVHYSQGKSHIELQTDPQVVLFEDIESLFNGVAISKDIIDCKREECELKRLFELSLPAKGAHPVLSLVDGSLLFWHLEGKSNAVRSFFFDEYIKVLEHFYSNDLLIAGYISAPRSRELISLIKYAYTILDEYDDGSKGMLFNHSNDSMIMRRFLLPGYRSTLFWTHSPIAQEYPGHVRPYFFYINCGSEIARVEVPYWIAHNSSSVSALASLIYDQVEKGYGYPMVLAEAHEQAVIKSSDRDFFYTLFYKSSIEHRQKINFSQKSLKKRRMSL